MLKPAPSPKSSGTGIILSQDRGGELISSPSVLLLNADRNLLRLDLLGLRQGDIQHTILVAGFDLVGLNRGGEREAATERSITSLYVMIVGIPLLLLLLLIWLLT